MTAPSRFCHVVYKTHRYNEMIEWYQKVFEASSIVTTDSASSLMTTNIIAWRF